MTFAELGVDQDLVDALTGHGILEPFPIQAQTIPLGLSGQDIIGQAKTGTGKTLGFGLPIIQRLGHDPKPGVQVLVVVPTRELCVQVAEDLVMATANRPTTVAAIYGGKAYEGQIEALKAGAQIIVGTPGRLLDLAGQRLISFADVREMVLDEADKMLDLGFLPDIEKLFAQTPPARHTMLFSATMPGAIVALARRFMNRPVHIRATDPDEGLTQANIEHLVYRAHSLDKDEVIARILQAEGRGKTVIFTRTKRAAARLQEELSDRGFDAAAVHGDLGQDQRERAMQSFRTGKKDVLIATDVAARGIDVDDVTHVINHTIPEDADAYLHRAGRTGRAGQDRHRRDLRRLGRPAQVGPDRQGARVRQARAGRDLLLLPAPVRGAAHPRRHQGPPAARAERRRRSRPHAPRRPRPRRRAAATRGSSSRSRSRTRSGRATSRRAPVAHERADRGRRHGRRDAHEGAAHEGTPHEEHVPGSGTHDGSGKPRRRRRRRGGARPATPSA